MSEPHESEQLSRAVEGYLVARYPSSDLRALSKRAIQEQDSHLARSLYNWRDAHGWPAPATIGEYRCVVCHKPMEDEPSMAEDEMVCAACVGSEDESQ